MLSGDGAPSVPAGRSGAMARPMRKNNDVFRQQFHKVTLCRFEAAGMCRLGDECTYAHNVQELRPYPDISKTSLCPAWRMRRCPLRAHECPFAHGKREMRLNNAYAALSARQQSRLAISPHNSGKASPFTCAENFQFPTSEMPSKSEEDIVTQLTHQYHPDKERQATKREYELFSAGLSPSAAAEQLTHQGVRGQDASPTGTEPQELYLPQAQAKENLVDTTMPAPRWRAPSGAEAESDMDRQRQELLAQQAPADGRQWAAPPSADQIARGKAERQARGQPWEMPLRMLCGETEAARRAARRRARNRAALRTSRYQELVFQQVLAEDDVTWLRSFQHAFSVWGAALEQARAAERDCWGVGRGPEPPRPPGLA